MADITMCEGGDCPLKESCYRFRAPKNPYRQAFFVNIPYQNGECKKYERIEGRQLEGMK